MASPRTGSASGPPTLRRSRRPGRCSTCARARSSRPARRAGSSPAAYLARARAAGRATARRNGAQVGGRRAGAGAAARPRDRRRCATRSGCPAACEIGGRARAVAAVAAGLAPVGDGEYARAARAAAGQADAPGRRARVRPARRRGARRRASRSSSSARFRTNAEQARLFAAHPDPRWVARPGHVAAPARHRARPRAAGGVRLARGARGPVRVHQAATRGSRGTSGSARSPGQRVGRVRRARRRRAAARSRRSSRRASPRRCAAASSRWGVGAALLAAQLQQESGFDPRSRSAARARSGIAQFMPGTARLYGLRDPLDPDAAIDAQAHLMHDLLRAVRLRPAGARGLQRRAGPRRARAAACRRSPRRRPTSSGSSRSRAASARAARPARPVRLVG